MKRLMYIMGYMITLLVGSFVVNIAMAATPEKYLNGDENYRLVSVRQDYGLYVNMGSIEVLAQDERGIMFAVPVVTGDYSQVKAGEEAVMSGSADDGVVFVRLYKDPWNVVYQFNPGTKKLELLDLTSAVGYNQAVIQLFVAGWQHIKGEAYPNVPLVY